MTAAAGSAPLLLAQGRRPPRGRARPLHRRSRPAGACSTRPCLGARTPTPASSPSTRAAAALPGRVRRAHAARRPRASPGRSARSSPPPPPCPTTAWRWTARATSASPWPRWPRSIAPPPRTRSSCIRRRVRPARRRWWIPRRRCEPGATLLYPELGTNVVWHDTLTYGDVDGAMARAHGVLRERFTIQRYASTPLETFGVMAAYDAGSTASSSGRTTSGPG